MMMQSGVSCCRAIRVEGEITYNGARMDAAVRKRIGFVSQISSFKHKLPLAFRNLSSALTSHYTGQQHVGKQAYSLRGLSYLPRLMPLKVAHEVRLGILLKMVGE